MDSIDELKATANISAYYRKKWIAEDNWVFLIRHHNPLTSVSIDRLRTAAQAKAKLLEWDGNGIGVYKKQIDGGEEPMRFYRVDDPHSKVMHTFQGLESTEVVSPVTVTPVVQPAKKRAKKDASDTATTTTEPVQPSRTSTPFLTGLVEEFRDSAVETLRQQRETGSVQWTSRGGWQQGNTSARRYGLINASPTVEAATQLEATLHAMARGNEVVAMRVLVNLLNRPHQSSLRDKLKTALNEKDKELKVNKVIVDNISAFIKRNKTDGRTKRSDEEERFDEVAMVAASFSDQQAISSTMLLQRLGVERTRGRRPVEWGRELFLEEGKRYEKRPKRLQKARPKNKVAAQDDIIDESNPSYENEASQQNQGESPESTPANLAPPLATTIDHHNWIHYTHG